MIVKLLCMLKKNMVQRPPTKFIGKLLISFLVITVVSLIPGKIGWVIQLAILIPLSCLLACALYAGLRELRLFHRGRKLESSSSGKPRRYKHITYNGIDVFYTSELNGGGLGLSFEFVRLVSKHFGKVAHIHEHCAGPGFIGFNLLSHNLCDRLTLSDVNPKAVEAIRHTIRQNKLEDRVEVYQSDCLDSVPASATWDLMVSNPPWDIRTTREENLVLDDPGARLHKKLLAEAPRYLKPDGSILLVESHEYTSLEDMKALTIGTGLEVAQYFPPVPFTKIWQGLREYPGVSPALALSLRSALCLFEIYLVRLNRS